MNNSPIFVSELTRGVTFYGMTLAKRPTEIAPLTELGLSNNQESSKTPAS